MPTEVNVSVIIFLYPNIITYVQVTSIAVQLETSALAKVYFVANRAPNFDVVLPMQVVPVNTLHAVEVCGVFGMADHVVPSRIIGSHLLDGLLGEFRATLKSKVSSCQKLGRIRHTRLSLLISSLMALEMPS
jgi:hypothetical protein